MTWEQYYQIANWFNENQDEVPYGTGHQARQYDSLMCDFSNILWSYGGDYFDSAEIGSLGTANPGPCTLDEPNALEAAEFYKLLSIAHPGSVSWDWNATDEAFRTEQVAMVPNWHEFAAVDQDPAESTIVGKIGYSPLPQGPGQKREHVGRDWRRCKRRLADQRASGLAVPGLGHFARHDAYGLEERRRGRDPDTGLPL